MSAGIEINASDECMAGMAETMSGRGKPDFTVTSAVVSHSGASDGCIGFVIDWESKSAGFGQLAVSVYRDGRVKLDTECMGREFVKAVLAKLVDDAEVK
jgi:hypothetical protein